MPESAYARSFDDALQLVDRFGFPVVFRPSFTLGGVGGGIAYNMEEFRDLARRGIELSPVHEVLIEESVIGWKEFELEVMRDAANNFVVICSIENIDPMGVQHRRQHHRRASPHPDGQGVPADARRRAPHHQPGRRRDGRNRTSSLRSTRDDGQMVAIEMNPRVSRSSALASKATGFPIAKIAAKLALGYRLDEIPNDITRLTPASFEPAIDYVVVKVPRWTFEKFPKADRTLTTQMKSVGEAMAIGRTFKEAFLKGMRSLEIGQSGLLFPKDPPAVDPDPGELRRRLVSPTDRRMWAVFEALGSGWSVDQLHEVTRIDRWFLAQFAGIGELRRSAGLVAVREMSDELLRALKRAGFGDEQIGVIVARGRGRRGGAADRAGRAARLQAHRYLRRGVRVVHAVPLRGPTRPSARPIRPVGPRW